MGPMAKNYKQILYDEILPRVQQRTHRVQHGPGPGGRNPTAGVEGDRGSQQDASAVAADPGQLAAQLIEASGGVAGSGLARARWRSQPGPAAERRLTGLCRTAS